MPDLKLTLFNEPLAICRLASGSPIPAWALSGSFWSITHTSDELSLVCLETQIPAGIQSDSGWRALKVEGPLDFALTGILAGLAQVLANENISLFAVSTFDTDYILVKVETVAAAVRALQTAGYLVKDEASRSNQGTIHRRDFLKKASLSLAAGLLSACTGATHSQPAGEEASQSIPISEGLTGQVSIMGPKNELPDQDFDGFKEQNPGVLVEQLEPDAARLAQMLAAGTPPDIIRTDGADLQSLLLRKIPLDLTGYYATSPILKEDDFAPACEYYHVNGKWYGLPKDWSPDFSFYMNTKIASDAEVSLPPFDQSITYAELFDLARRLTQIGDGSMIIGYGYEQSFFARQVMAILLEEDRYLYSEDFGKVIIKDNPIVMDVLQGFTDISKEGITWSPTNPCPTWSGQEFINGTQAIAGYGYWYHAMLNTPAEGAKVGAAAAAFFPAPTWTGKKVVNPTIGGTGYIATRETKNPDAAWAFLEWYLGDRPAAERAASGWGVPALLSLYEKMPQANDFQKQVRQVLQHTFDHGDADYALKFNPYYADQGFNASFIRNLETVLKGSMSVSEMAIAIEIEVNAAIEEGRSAAA